MIIKGFHIELIGPTMPILAANAKFDYNRMGSVLGFRGAGYLIANIIGAVLQNIVKNHSEAVLVCAFILPAIGEISFFIKKDKQKKDFLFSCLCYTVCVIIDSHVSFIFCSRHWSRFHQFR